ncbi:MAG: serine protease [Candidatus Parabeggiatoa sp.]|nr:serine protease [Candidatus Parabeggiatoa sp.]
MRDEALKKRIHNEIANATVKIWVADEFQGSGVFITPDGYVLTAYHCIGEYPPKITIETRFGDQFKAELDEEKSLKHPQYDIAVLKIDDQAAHYLPLGTISNQNTVGDEIVATGYLAGHNQISFFFSQISQNSTDNKIQIPNAIKGKGQSGGPVYHYATNRVIGLATEGYKQDVIMDTGLATRFDALFKKWPKLEIINNKVVQAWEKRLLELGYGGNEPEPEMSNQNDAQTPIQEEQVLELLECLSITQLKKVLLLYKVPKSEIPPAGTQGEQTIALFEYAYQKEGEQFTKLLNIIYKVAPHLRRGKV